jgi:hypothetical protein
MRQHKLGDEPKQIRDLDHFPQRTLLEVLALTLVSVWVWILIEGSVMEGEPLRQLRTDRTEKGEERSGEVEHRKEQREWERPSPLLHQTNQSSPFPRPRANHIERGLTRLRGGRRKKTERDERCPCFEQQ